MAHTLNRLSPAEVENQKTPGYYADGGGLYFRVAPGGARGWIFRFVMHGRTRDCGLGSYPEVSLANARENKKARKNDPDKWRRYGALDARECRDLLTAEQDPIEYRKERRAAAAIEEAKAMTFDQCAAAYIAEHEAGWRNAKHRQQWTNTLRTYVSPVFGRLPVQAVDTGLVLKVLRPLWTTKTETAMRLRMRIEAILNWATVNKLRSGDNPARWGGHLEGALPKPSKVRKVKHHAALPYAALPAFLTRIREQPGVGARALEFTILTAARTGETLGATGAEIKDGVWIVPAERMKAAKEHRIPLSPRALALVGDATAAEAGDGAFIFPGGKQGRPLSNMAMAAVLKRMGHREITPHGFRSTFRDWAAEETHYPNEVVEMALAHSVGNKVEAAYRRGDLFEKRCRLMADWGKFCQHGKAVTGQLVQLRA